MCFSPQADLVGSIVVTGIGVDAIRHVGGRRDHVALATLPLLLGLHQAIEAVVWWSAQGHVPHALGHIALWGYLLIAFVALPIFVPAVVLWSEPNRRRQLEMVPFVVIGVYVAGRLLAAMIRGPISVSPRPYHLSYSIRLGDGALIIVLYVIAVCGTLLCSHYRTVRAFGVVNLVAIGFIAWLTVDGFASVWCAWAAITSGAIAARMRFLDPPRQHAHALT